MTDSSAELRGFVRTAAVFHPPSTTSSSSVSSPLSERRSAIDESGGCEDEVPACAGPPWCDELGMAMSCVRTESESDSVPETGLLECVVCVAVSSSAAAIRGRAHLGSGDRVHGQLAQDLLRSWWGC